MLKPVKFYQDTPAPTHTFTPQKNGKLELDASADVKIWTFNRREVRKLRDLLNRMFTRLKKPSRPTRSTRASANRRHSR